MTIRIAACALLLSAAVASAADDKSATLDRVLGRIASYMARYESQLSIVVADEHYEQESTDWGGVARTPVPERRVLESDFLFLRSPGGRAWLGMRDTFAVDGKDVRAADTGLLRDLRTGGDALAQALAIATANARRNLGPLFRTINVPTTTLDFFTERNLKRLRVKKSGEDRSGGHVSWILSFNETERPTLIRTVDGRNERARGRVWVDPESGAVERTVLDLGDGSRDDGFLETRITVVYANEPTLGFAVPVEMVEAYYRPPSREYPQLRITTHATYSHFRRFEVSAKIVLPQD